ncbi:uncharacterized protein N7525_009294, partial [Penicillium rubens]|uniref:uncharacterized protein n=1 Tax=Penicillium rubens TaxID=1108849 RepID=UPI002A5A9340
ELEDKIIILRVERTKSNNTIEALRIKYIIYNYLKKKLTLAIIITTSTINPLYIDKIIELKANTDLGKNIKDKILNIPLSYKKEDKSPLPIIDISIIRRVGFDR